MSDENEEIGAFVFGIKLFRDSKGKIDCYSQTVNEQMPEELIIMNMKAFVQKIEKKFFDRFESEDK